MQEPRGKDRGDSGKAKPVDFTVAQRTPASGDAFPLARAVYSISVHDPGALPPEGPPEIAFAGRSNAGKSSAINTLAGRRRLAFVSKTPGRTQLINFFSLGGRAYLVDLPGYGYAGVPDAVRRHWKHLVGTYIESRGSLAGVVLVMDVRHPFTDLDNMLLEALAEAGRPVHVLLTKSDKLSKQAAQSALSKARVRLDRHHPQATAQLFSSLQKTGVEEAAARLAAFVERKK